MSAILYSLIIPFFVPVAFAVGSPHLANSPTNIDWGEFEDILQLPTPEISTNRLHIPSEPPITQSNSPQKNKQTRKRSKETIKRATENEKTKMQHSSEYAEKRKAQKAAAGRKFRLKMKETISEERKRENKEKNNRDSRKRYQITKERFRGAYGNAEARQYQESNQKMKLGIATLEDLKRVKEHREKFNEAARKFRHKKQKIDQGPFH